MQLIIFDFDGTLADSRKLIVEAHRRVFSEFGLPVPTPEASLALIGRSLELVLAELAGPEAPVAAMTAAYQPLVKELRADPAFADLPFAGVSELLVELGARSDLRLGIATGHNLKRDRARARGVWLAKTVLHGAERRHGAVKAASRHDLAGA